MIDTTIGRAASWPEDRAVADLAAWARMELTGNILPYWRRRGRDVPGEGFLGEIREDDVPVPAADRSVVMVARHLWTFSAASAFLSAPAELSVADDAYRYLLNRFRDRENGGFYWTVAPDGEPAVAKKQVYGQAFAIYGLSQYAQVPYLRREVRAEALSFALALFELLERTARDRGYGGYAEALSADWKPTPDRALSPADMDCDKSMNTNLHMLEALTNLYRATRAAEVREAVVSLLDVHARRIVRGDGHLGLYFRDDWTPIGDSVSYGHDIEASWLMEEAAEALAAPAAAGRRGADPKRGRPDEAAVFAAVRDASNSLAESALNDGLDAASGALEEAVSCGPGRGHRVWWCQAEAMVGFFAAWQRTGDRRYLDAAVGVRDYVERAIVDRRGGEWRWGADAADRPIPALPKGGNWKTGYHNGRSCMELMRRAAAYL